MANERYAGTHILADFWGARSLEDPEVARKALLSAAEAAGFVVLNTFSHDFGEGFGVSAILALATSHISIHTWPEHGLATVDIFTCGSSNPYKALAVLVDIYAPVRVETKEIKRGVFHA